MTETEATKAAPGPDGVSAPPRLDPAVRAVLAYALVAVGAAITAYFTLFTQFAPYDDEGTVLVTVKAFAEGNVLYEAVYSPYGPFYFELFGGLFALTGWDVTTDASRTIVVVVWVATAFLFGLAAQRLSGRLTLGVLGMIAAFGALPVLGNEPMHPQGLCVLLLSAIVLLAVAGPGARPWASGIAWGAVLAALVMTKTNVGLFAVAASALAAVWVAPGLPGRKWLFWAAALAFLALPLAVAGRDLTDGWVRELLLFEALAMVALLVASWPLRAQGEERDRPFSRWLLAGAVGLVTASAAILVAIWLAGSSPADVYRGVVTEAMRVRDVLVIPFVVPAGALNWGIAAVAAAFLWLSMRKQPARSPWPGLLRGVAGAAILLAITGLVPVGLNPSAGSPITLPLVLVWIAALPPSGVREGTHKRFLRVMLPALAILETLQIYPVAGSQVGIASVSFVPVGILCIVDALTSLRAWYEARADRPVAFGLATTVVAVALCAMFGLHSILRPAADKIGIYNDQTPLPFPGASAVRLPQPDVETYAALVDLLHENRCTAFIGYPNLNSLYLWSGIDAPSPRAPGAWINALDAKYQQQAVDALRASPRPCAIRSQARADLWLHGAPPPDRPLVNYVLDDFRPVAEVGEFEFALPKERAGG